ncbi:MAG: hypothetical protein ABI772_10240 [Bacteroidota bacterium]
MKEGFENYINDKADGFKMEPDAKLWDAIQKKINEKRKRRFIFWWFFACVLITASGLLLLKPNPSSHKINKHIEQNAVVQEKSADENNLYIKEFENSKVSVDESDAAYSDKTKSPVKADNKIKSTTRIKEQIVAESPSVPEKTEKEITALQDISEGLPVQLPVNITGEVKDTTNINDTEKDSTHVSENDLLVVEEKDSTTSNVDSSERDKEENTDSIKPGKWSVGISVFGGNGFNAFHENTNKGNIAAYREKNTNGALSFSPGAFIYYQLSEKLEIGAGIEYFSIKEITKNKQPIYKNDTIVNATSSVPSYNIITVLSSALVDSTKTSSAEITNSYHYLSFPFCLNYKFLQSGKFSLGLNVKLAYSILLISDHFEYNYLEPEFRNYSGTHKGNLRSGGISAGLGISADYRITQKTGVFISPEFRKNFYSLYNGDYIFDQNYSAVGLSFGVRYFFK